MRFVFLGTGTSSGIPAIACDCAVCTSTDPHDQRLRTGAAIQFTDAAGQDRTILLDATPDLRLQALRARLRRCDAVLFTHNHVDHVFGLDEVRRFNVVQRAPIDIYAEPRTLDHLRRVYQHIFDAPSNVNPSFVATLIVHSIAPEAPVDLYGLRVTPIRLLHGRLPILGFRIDPPASPPTSPSSSNSVLSPQASVLASSSVLPLAYCTDVSGIPPESWPLLRGVRTLVLDALRHRKHPTHYTLQEAVSIADQVGAQRTLFVHMAHDLPHEATNASLPDTMRLAYDGLVLE
jgi:phosphoribosyl 1,2-cyclic phosphate phosphodiesterase